MFFGVFVVALLFLVALRVGHVEREIFVRLWSHQKMTHYDVVVVVVVV